MCQRLGEKTGTQKVSETKTMVKDLRRFEKRWGRGNVTDRK